MSKAHRGRPLRKEGFERGTCPVVGIKGVKLIYDYQTSDGQKLKVSKSAYAKAKNEAYAKTRKNKKITASPDS